MSETSYQRNKRLLAETRAQLFKVCTDPDSPEAKIIAEEVKFRAQVEDMLMYGNPIVNDKIG